MAVEVVLMGEIMPCNFIGTAQLVHDIEKGFLRGTVVLELVSGPPACPPEMAAELTGNADGFAVAGILFGGVLGEAEFSGQLVNPPGRKGLGPVLGGGFKVIAGPYENSSSGGWAGSVSDGVFKDSFETLVIVSAGSTLLLLGFGLVSGRRPD